MIPTTADYAWAAGFLDGDGSFSLGIVERKSKVLGAPYTMHQPKIQASQNDPKPLIRLVKILCLDAPLVKLYAEAKPWGQHVHKMNVTGREKLIPFLQNIIPHLTSKQQQAILLLEAAEMMNGRGGAGKNHSVYTDAEKIRFKAIKQNIEALNAFRDYPVIRDLEVDAK